MELNEVKIGDLVSFRHKKKQVKGKVIHRHDGAKHPALAGHVNVQITGDKSYPVTVHVAKLRPIASLKEEHTMENTVSVQDLLTHITDGNNIEAEQTLNVLLQDKINELLSAAKVEVAQEMFNTQECADCEAEEVDEALIGGQKKIDANHNGKIDAQDFKMLRAKKKGMKEETEELEEGNAENKAKKNAFVTKVGSQVSKFRERSDKTSGRAQMRPQPHNSAIDKRDYQKSGKDAFWKKKGIGTGVHKEEVETLDEYQKGLFNPPAGFTKKGIEKGKGVKTTYNYTSKKSTTPVGATMNLGGVKVELGKKGMKKEEAEHVEEATLSAKAARAGKDIGKKGKNFKKIAAKAGKKYGSKAAGERVAGAILKKMRAKAGK